MPMHRPVTILAPTLQAVLAGTCQYLRRPEGTLSQCQPGDRLWIREKFRLPASCEAFSPLQALERGASPVFLADEPDLPEWALKDLGRIRFARELPRAWHRAHLVITSIERVRLQLVTPEEIEQAGFETYAHFIAAWDAGLSLQAQRGASLKWKSNPEVLQIGFHRVAQPMPDAEVIAA